MEIEKKIIKQDMNLIKEVFCMVVEKTKKKERNWEERIYMSDWNRLQKETLEVVTVIRK